MIVASICPICYAEIPAEVYAENNETRIRKEHCGRFWDQVAEPDHAFTVQAHEHAGDDWKNLEVCLVEVTHRCNNKCPNCYHAEDNGLADPTLDELEARVQAISDRSICFIGGEPTMRPDLPELITRLKAGGRNIAMYTNGIKLDDEAYVRELDRAGLLGVAFSLHHPDYSHPKVLERKRAALEVLRHRVHLPIEHIAFSLQSEDQIPGILDEIERYTDYAWSFRIRSGYQPTNQMWYVSDLYKLVKAEADRRGKSLEFYHGAENTRYQVGFKYDGISLWLMSWPSDLNIDLSQARGYPHAAFLPGAVQHFCRSVVTQEGWRKGWFNGARVAQR